MIVNPFISALFMIFTGAVALSTVALYTRQSMLIAYMFVGILFGPAALKWVNNADEIQKIGDVGIIFPLVFVGFAFAPSKSDSSP